MAKIIFTDPSITLNAVDISSHVTQIEISTTAPDVDVTGFGPTEGMEYAAGKPDNEVTLTMIQDYDAGKIDATIWPLLRTETTLVAKPTSEAVGATNPSFTMKVLVSNYTPLAATVNERGEVSVTWKVNGAITRAVA